MKYVLLAGVLALAGCASDVVYRGAPPAGYTDSEYACKLKGGCSTKRWSKSWDTPDVGDKI